jgi:hypothetical protein
MNYFCYKDYESVEFITMILQCFFIAFQDVPMLFAHIVRLIVESKAKHLLESLTFQILFINIFSIIFQK